MSLRSNAVGLLVFAAAAGACFAGPLNPPAGAVISSMKTLSEVEPRTALSATNTPGDAASVFKITQPGSYYLTGDVTVTAAKSGVVIVASNVTLDLNGFSITGAGPTAQHGVQSSNMRNVVVKNGTVRSIGGAGVFNDGPACRVENMAAYACSGAGLYLSGAGCTADRCIVDTSTGTGVKLGDNGIARGCTVLNAYYGFDTGTSTLITGCVAKGNSAAGFDAGCGSEMVECIAEGNAHAGFDLCQATVLRCTATSNAHEGIAAGGASQVIGCAVNANQLEGITGLDHCVIRDNLVRNSGAAGVRLTGSGNHVEANHIAQCPKGVQSDAAGNLVVGNSVTSCPTAFVLVAGTRYGPIVSLTSGVSPAVNGSTSVASSLSTTDPKANFIH
jgi:hypothetical protein